MEISETGLVNSIKQHGDQLNRAIKQYKAAYRPVKTGLFHSNCPVIALL